MKLESFRSNLLVDSGETGDLQFPTDFLYSSSSFPFSWVIMGDGNASVSIFARDLIVSKGGRVLTCFCCVIGLAVISDTPVGEGEVRAPNVLRRLPPAAEFRRERLTESPFVIDWDRNFFPPPEALVSLAFCLKFLAAFTTVRFDFRFVEDIDGNVPLGGKDMLACRIFKSFT